jgi:rhamnosyltransferase
MVDEHISIVALIITYDPDERLLLSLDHLRGMVDGLVVVDNGSRDKGFMGHMKEHFDANAMTVIELNTNLGIAVALNHGVRYIMDHFATDYILTLDDDSIVLCDVREIITQATSMFDHVGLISLGTDRSKKSVAYREVNFVIGSGSVIRSGVYKTLRYREEFFLDQADFDLDYNIRKLGYKIVLADGYLMDHLLGMEMGSLRYEPPFRMYYIVRNSVVMLMEGSFPLRDFLPYVSYWSRSTIMHDGFVAYLRLMLVAVSDGIFRHLGRRDFQVSCGKS